MPWLLDQAVFIGKEGREFWWVAPVSATASIAFKRFERNEDVWAAVLDEASRMREHAYYAIRSTLAATKG